ncbi:MAG TPA: aminotransferase class V-fold PLP-dependent enzyme, partial [Kiloniellales bacterium]|nr:aminotransferase class V-fold PLP-dependent enzyme [Kiloniellales bacterium]
PTALCPCSSRMFAPRVAATMHALLEGPLGYPSSGHWASGSAGAILEKARGQTAALLGAASDEIVFASGGSEANNMVLKGSYFALRDRGE